MKNKQTKPRWDNEEELSLVRRAIYYTTYDQKPNATLDFYREWNGYFRRYHFYLSSSINNSNRSVGSILADKTVDIFRTVNGTKPFKNYHIRCDKLGDKCNRRNILIFHKTDIKCTKCKEKVDETCMSDMERDGKYWKNDRYTVKSICEPCITASYQLKKLKE